MLQAKIGPADLRRCPSQADGADELPHPYLLLGKDMLDG